MKVSLGTCDWCDDTDLELQQEKVAPFDWLCKKCAKLFGTGWEGDTEQLTYFTTTKAVVRLCKHSMTPFQVGEHTVYLSGYRDREKDPKPLPTSGVYLDNCWILGRVFAEDRATTGNKTMYIAWPDMQAVPIKSLVQGVRWINHKLEGGERVEIGCVGGHGRTGTMVASLLVSLGMSAKKAIKDVRKRYCDRAIETKAQENMLKEFEKWLTSR